MIAFIRGTVSALTADGLVVDLGGVGISASCTPATALSLAIGERVELVTSLVIREESWTLFAFTDPDEKTVFEIVQTVSGIGPRLALGLLATLSANELRTAVARDDLATLTKVPGIGRKGAGRLVLELKDRLGPPQGVVASTAAVAAGWQASVIAGLTSLGWTAKEAERAATAVEPLAEEQSGEPDVGALLKAALRTLDRS
jgi:Holliday junction DNA helicase RuvA